MKKTAYYTCSYVPLEIPEAAGFHVKRLLPEKSPSDGDSNLHAGTCLYCKSLAAAVLDETSIRGGDRVVFAACCDGMNRTFDVLKHYRPGLRPLVLDVPKKKDADTVALFAENLKKLAREMEREWQGTAVTEKALRRAIKSWNAHRARVNGLLRSPLTGSRMYALLREAADGGMGAEGERPAAPAKSGGPRIVVAGSALNRPGLIECIEELGGDVVLIDTCFGARFYDTAVHEKASDPYLALAERYLTKASCPRMEGTGERIAHLVDSARKAAADGVLYTAVKYCDNSFYEVPETGRRFKEEDIPFLFIENDYEWANLGPVKTRVQAFLEMIRMKPA